MGLGAACLEGLELSLINIDDRFKHYEDLVRKENVNLKMWIYIYIYIYIYIHEYILLERKFISMESMIHIYGVHNSYL